MAIESCAGCPPPKFPNVCYCKDPETGIHGYGNTPEGAQLDLQMKLAEYRNWMRRNKK